MSTILSIYIPIISEGTSEDYIKKMFESHKLGNVMRVDFVLNKAKNRREAFVHFHEWFDNEKSKEMQEDIQNIDKNVKFMYNPSGKFWPLLPNRNAHKRVENPNYEILKNKDIKVAITAILTSNTKKATAKKSDENEPKKVKFEETYASKVICGK